MAEIQPMEQFARSVVAQLSRAGHIAYFAGGCVRDQLLGVPPKDFDVATSAKPDEVRGVFGHRRTLAIGQSFGVITVLGKQAQQVEVATFRADGEYSDGRRPDEVIFSSAEEDAARRDFTINGMFYDPTTEQVIDFVGGRADLEAKIIRAIGVPQDRIEEDRLRMLRAVRFASTYEFEIEDETLDAIRSQHEQISIVSQERITHELQRMLVHTNRTRACELLVASQLMACVLPEVERITGDEIRWRRLLSVLDVLGTCTFESVLAALFGKNGAGLDAKRFSAVARRMKLSNDTRKAGEWVLENRESLEACERLKFSAIQPLLVSPSIRHALPLMAATIEVDGDSASPVRWCESQLGRPSEQLDPDPLIRGDDLAAAGVTPGPEFARLLKRVRAAQLDGEIRTKDEAIQLALKHVAQTR